MSNLKEESERMKTWKSGIPKWDKIERHEVKPHAGRGSCVFTIPDGPCPHNAIFVGRDGVATCADCKRPWSELEAAAAPKFCEDPDHILSEEGKCSWCGLPTKGERPTQEEQPDVPDLEICSEIREIFSRCQTSSIGSFHMVRELNRRFYITRKTVENQRTNK